MTNLTKPFETHSQGKGRGKTWYQDITKYVFEVCPISPIQQGSYLLSHPTRPCFWAAKVDYNNADQMSNWNTGAGIKYIWFVLEKLQCCKYYSLFCSVNSISSKITGYKLFLSQYIVNMLNRIICKEHQNSWVKYD